MFYDQRGVHEAVDDGGADGGVFARPEGLLDVGAVAEGVDGGLDELARRRRRRVDDVKGVYTACWGTGWAAGERDC